MHHKSQIRYIGVFDTVGSLKAQPLWSNTKHDDEIARKTRKRHDGPAADLNKVDNVFQALAFDERRFDFYPAVLAQTSEEQNFKQTWFPRLHADIGGRYSTPLGLFPMIWTASKLQEATLLEFDDEYIRLNLIGPLFERRAEAQFPTDQP